MTYTTVATDNRITGIWQYDDLRVTIESIPVSRFYKELIASISNREEKKSAFDGKEDSILYTKSYVADFTRNGYRYYMICSLMRLGNELFANIEPASALPDTKRNDKDVNELFSGGSYIRSSSVAKVVFRGSEIEFRFLNSEFIREQLKNGRLAIKYEKDELFNTDLITASSKDLQQFLVKYGNDGRLYSKENTVTLKKVGS